ncbi:GNAT family N-acetyltransferase [Clostridium butyricum]|jgi:ribosomal protein S18 acetylase RimI-like enzyme|uniref:GNAT family N-acetyltransferase n=1 Tax=Clostridium butyricum TaxID=1492 RepID=A0A512TNV0_CLOBU|nr:GNAT family N-acetyltransferase [Clostridium butyricum]ETI90372.1 MAG: NH2-acetyltransferase [Clostridium butyricum DORA_1]MDU1006360.1 GNAT family N-acetyltransferase [Clostridium butyricum]MDU1509340.1 GNAT family N-acetyltransferase [Clostridium butyricum]MDU4802067.1 GNAT family N-acetyltransferase [Clostridium butyricum]MDU5724016.1 GNAT family N-acetyltransferase [Clostridium butyricum]
MNIRLATKEDLNEIIKIESICFPEAEAAKESDFQKRFDAFKENFIIAEDNGKIIGFINGCTTDLPKLPDELYHNVQLHKKHGDYQTIFGLNVLPDYRRNGVAAQLMNYFIELSKERGKKGMVLTCKNHLIHYYEKFGFKHQGVSASEHGGAVWNDMVLIF